MIKQLTIALLALTLAGFQSALAQNDEGFIYGKITTIDDEIYEGPMRWGKEEVYWTDMFNAGKRENENIDYLSRDERDILRDHKRRSRSHWGGLNFDWSWDWDDDFTHQLSIQFGELKALYVTGRERLDVELQGGMIYEITGNGYNDIGAKIRILDNELGELEMRWSRIDKIEFMPTPSKLNQKFGEPLYGTVETRNGSFTGFVQWDHDERVSTDKLDGDTRDGDMSIEFGRLKSIERDGNGCEIELQSGRTMFLRGSNDVDYDNRGVIVTTDYGRIDIEWREFLKVTFQKAPGSGPSYASFSDQKELTGSVMTRGGKTLKGKIVYDLDEAYDFEVLQGDFEDMEYIIPFRNISKITPRGYDESIVELKNGQTLRLEDGIDVSEENNGILVFQDKNNPIYVEWQDVDEVTFN
ncbi:MAG: hypothetical protein RJQ09_16430 [Cyclobacteriaceae bacterium]